MFLLIQITNNIMADILCRKHFSFKDAVKKPIKSETIYPPKTIYNTRV